MISNYSLADCGFGIHKYLVRLLTYLPGSVIAKIPCSPQVLYEVGKMAAKIDTIMQEVCVITSTVQESCQTKVLQPVTQAFQAGLRMKVDHVSSSDALHK